MPQGRHRRSPPPARGPGRILAATRGPARILAAAVLALLLLPSVVACCASVTLRETVTNPAYVMDVLRQTGLLSEVKTEFLDSLVASVGLEPADEAALREALDEGIPLSWLDSQLERTLEALAAYLTSGATMAPAVDIALAEVKFSLLAAIREHMDETYYLEAAQGLGNLPDTVDIGKSFNSEALRRLRPAWRGVVLAPWWSAGVTALLSFLLWLVLGRGPKGLAGTGAVWVAGGVAVMILAVVLGLSLPSWLAASVPSRLPELELVSLPRLAGAGLDGVREEFLSTGVSLVIAGIFALSLPRAERELLAPPSRRSPASRRS